MKRFISIFFTLCLVVALTLSASAESTNKLTYAVGASAPTVSANTEFTVLVKVTENTGICWAKAVVSFDSSVLTYVSYSTDTSAFPTDMITVNEGSGKVTVTLGSMEVIFADNPTIYSAEGTIVALKFKANANAPIGSSTTISVNSTQSNVVKRVNKVSEKDFDITAGSMSFKIMSSDHTCTPAPAVKENEVAATCKAEGRYESVVYCSLCSTEISREVKTTPKLDHTAGTPNKENVVAATCLASGSYEEVVKCTACGTELSRKKVDSPKLEHTPGSSKIENLVDSTCTVKGHYDLVVYCSVCNTKISSEKAELTLAAHTPGEHKIENEVAATCSKPGSYDEVTYCFVCEAEVSRVNKETSTIEHVNAGSVQENRVESTCTKEGSYDEVVYCSVCKTEVARVTVKLEKGDHKPAKAVEENRKPPVNCSADGTYESVVYCSACKVELSRDIKSIPAPGHTPGPAATETSPQICTVCQIVITPALAHTHHWSDKWSSDSVGHWHACSGCDVKNEYAQHEYTNGCDADCNICNAPRNVAGHTYDNDCDTTCNKCGDKRDASHKFDNDCDTKCDVCGLERPVTHKYDNNCDASCNICGVGRIPADHVYGGWTVTKEATDTADGSRERTCNVCKYVQKETIPATGEVTTEPPVVTTEPPVVTTEPPVVTTEPPVVTTDTTDVTSESPDVTTDDDVTTDPNVGTDKTDSDDGCGSAVSMGIAFIAILGTAIIMKKRD